MTTSGEIAHYYHSLLRMCLTWLQSRTLRSSWQKYAKHPNSIVANSGEFSELHYNFLKYLFCCSNLGIEFGVIYPPMPQILKKIKLWSRDAPPRVLEWSRSRIKESYVKHTLKNSVARISVKNGVAQFYYQYKCNTSTHQLVNKKFNKYNIVNF